MKPDESIRVHIRESEGFFVASCLELAIVTQGCTLDETVFNVREAVCLFLEDEDPEYIGVVRYPRILLTMEVETASAQTEANVIPSMVVSIFRRYGFEIASQEGSHVKLRRFTNSGDEQNIMVPRHRQIGVGALRAIYRQAIAHIPERILRRDFYTD